MFRLRPVQPSRCIRELATPGSRTERSYVETYAFLYQKNVTATFNFNHLHRRTKSTTHHVVAVHVNAAIFLSSDACST